MKANGQFLTFFIFCLTFFVQGAVDASKAGEGGVYINIQTFTLQHQREYVLTTEDPCGLIVESIHGQILRIKSGIAQGTFEGYLKWISADPNGYELDIEFSDARYIWKDIYEPSDRQL